MQSNSILGYPGYVVAKGRFPVVGAFSLREPCLA